MAFVLEIFLYVLIIQKANIFGALAGSVLTIVSGWLLGALFSYRIVVKIANF